MSQANPPTYKYSDKHPQYGYYSQDWVLTRDCYQGEREIKSKGQIYLPATSGQVADGMKNVDQPGYKSYQAYKTRARFPNFFREAVQTAIGMMHSQPPKITLPEAMKSIVSCKGEDIPTLLRRINQEQLISGRIGIMADVPTGKTINETVPYLATYSAERIVNWDDGASTELVPQKLNLVVLNETEFTRDGNSFSWVEKEKYRVLSLGDIEENVNDGIYRFGISDSQGDKESIVMTQASIGGRTLNEIPFVIVNSCDLVPDADEPPLLDLANLCVTIYRGEADYRQNLFMQGQDTLVIIGGSGDDVDEQIRTGAGARINVMQGGDAKYIGVKSSGLAEQRQALEADRKRAGSMGAQSLDTTSRERESGTSLNIRMAARTADLNQLAVTGAKGLENILKICAKWMGLDENEVSVEPNLDFGDNSLTGQSMLEMQTARNAGYPISAESLHQFAFDKGITKMTYQEEIQAADRDEKTIFRRAENSDRAPNQVNKDKPEDDGGSEGE